jgi:hypothetical protein
MRRAAELRRTFTILDVLGLVAVIEGVIGKRIAVLI